MKKKWIWIIGIIVVIALIGVAFGLKYMNNKAEENKGYDTYKVDKESPLNISGKASPQSVKIYNNNEQLGTYVSTLVEDGQTVKQGDQLINYDINYSKRQQLVNKVNEAQNIVNEDYREINLAPNNDDLQKKLSQDQGVLKEATQQLNQYDKQTHDSIYAAFDGKIDIKNDNKVSNGETILYLVAKEPQIKTTVSEFDLRKIKKGDKVDIKITSTGEKGKGVIKKIAELPNSFDEKLNKPSEVPAATQNSEGENSLPQVSNPVVNDANNKSESDSSKYTVIIGDIDIPVRSGYSMEISVPLETIKLPKSVLTKDHNVFVLNKDNKVEKRDIKFDKVNGEIFVKEGLKKGDKLIKNPKKTLNNGDKVEVSS
nr:efflux RND transporter periplasmic adaptor subunit [Mammaliicoccus sp. Marseille-Q6498]